MMNKNQIENDNTMLAAYLAIAEGGEDAGLGMAFLAQLLKNKFSK